MASPKVTSQTDGGTGSNTDPYIQSLFIFHTTRTQAAEVLACTTSTEPEKTGKKKWEVLKSREAAPPHPWWQRGVDISLGSQALKGPPVKISSSLKD